MAQLFYSLEKKHSPPNYLLSGELGGLQDQSRHFGEEMILTHNGN